MGEKFAFASFRCLDCDGDGCDACEGTGTRSRLIPMSELNGMRIKPTVGERIIRRVKAFRNWLKQN